MSGEQLSVLAGEQAALRRVATLVARGAPPEDVFTAAVGEVGQLLPVDLADMGRYEPDGTLAFVAFWGRGSANYPVGSRWNLEGRNLGTIVLKTGRPARIDSYADASGPLGVAGRERGFRAAVGTPIVVDGRLWGVVIAGSSGEHPLPADAEARLASFTELLATAIANAESHAGLARLAEEQAALRRVATLVARGAPPQAVFATVTEEVLQLLAVEYAHLGRYEPDGMVTFLATSGGTNVVLPVGSRWALGGKNALTIVLETGCPARLESYADASGPLATAARERGVRSSVATPIIVEGRLWGVIVVGSTLEQPVPVDTAARLASFTELLATAIANAESRAGLARLAEEQAALRRVATLVARGASAEEVSAAVVEEVGKLFPVDLATMGRYEPDATVTFVAAWGRAAEPFSVGSRATLGGQNLVTTVFETGRPARIDRYADASGPVGVTARDAGFRSSVGTPIVVDGHLWGVITAGSTLEAPLPADTEARLADFTELLATAIANAETGAGLARLAEEQAALRRVATLAARAAPPAEVFAAVAGEVQRLLRVDLAGMARYEPDGTVAAVASWGNGSTVVPLGTRWRLGGQDISTIVFETGRPARVDRDADAGGPPPLASGDPGFRSSVGTPIIVDGHLWGVMGVGSNLEPLPADTEGRLADFTELLATAIANAESRAALAASRARVVAAADATRRRIERDLHDGTQQRLVSLGLELRAAQATVPAQLGGLKGELSRVADGLTNVFEELREISHGIHPAVLSERGLVPALRALGRRSAVPVELDLHAERRFPDHVEAAVYYVVSEALTNAVKHAHASMAHVALDVRDATLRLAISDDGIGGADPTQGSGLVGLGDRVEALGGTLQVMSPTGGGTTLLIEIPV